MGCMNPKAGCAGSILNILDMPDFNHQVSVTRGVLEPEEIGDMICIGNSQVLYYCFPTEGKDVVAKTRLAAEELYKLRRTIMQMSTAISS